MNRPKYKLIEVATGNPVTFGDDSTIVFGGEWGRCDEAGSPLYMWIDNIPDINEVKQQKINQLNAKCQETICSGFYSSALGKPHKYESKTEDQLNMLGAIQMGIDLQYRCWNPEETQQEWYLHTKEQLQQVFLDGSIMVRQNLERVSSLKEQVSSALTIEEIEAINW